MSVFGFGWQQSPNLTAEQVVDAIKKEVNCDWSEKTVDTFKGGDPQTPIIGVATTFLATMDVLQRAASSGLNLVITHEPTYYNGPDDTSQMEGDKVLEAKRKFIAENSLVVWRFHDHIHRHQPDGIIEGMVRKLGWGKHRKPGEMPLFEFPELRLRQLARELKETFGTDSIRVIGDPRMQFTRVGLAPGAPGSIRQIRALQRDDVEVLVAGESREWETVEYVRDCVTQGRNKAIILLGHANSEEGGMEYCARWLRTFIKEIPVEFVPAGDPFWSP